MTTVTAAILVRDETVLIARRKEALSNGGRWEFPGGKLKAGESPRQCLKRELKEELGIEVRVTTNLGSVLFQDADQRIRFLFYRVEWTAGEIYLRDHSAVSWVGERELIQYDLTPPDLQFAQRLRFADIC